MSSPPLVPSRWAYAWGNEPGASSLALFLLFPPSLSPMSQGCKISSRSCVTVRAQWEVVLVEWGPDAGAHLRLALPENLPLHALPIALVAQ